MQRVAPARIEDLPRLGAFLLRAFDQAGPGALGWTGATPETIREMATPEFLTGLLGRTGTEVLLAEEDGEVVGFAVLQGIGSEEAELAGMIVLESRTGTGVGTALLDAAVRCARASAVRRLVVRTEAANERAIAFYCRHGFAVAGRITEEVQGSPVDLVPLRLDLPP